LTRNYGVIAPHARTSSNRGLAIAAAGYEIAGRQPSADEVSAGSRDVQTLIQVQQKPDSKDRLSLPPNSAMNPPGSRHSDPNDPQVPGDEPSVKVNSPRSW
jgi:hypothetical protein